MRSTEFVTELVNTQSFDPKFKKEFNIGDLTYVISGGSDKGIPKLRINVMDNGTTAAEAVFSIHSEGKNSWIESDVTVVKKPYRGKGIAKTIYSIAKKLGNDIRPSSEQSVHGKGMWDAWKKTGYDKELMPSDSQ